MDPPAVGLIYFLYPPKDCFKGASSLIFNCFAGTGSLENVPHPSLSVYFYCELLGSPRDEKTNTVTRSLLCRLHGAELLTVCQLGFQLEFKSHFISIKKGNCESSFWDC